MGPLVSAWFLRRWLYVAGFVAFAIALPLAFVSFAAERIFLLIGMVLVLAQVIWTLSRSVRNLRAVIRARKVESPQ